MSILKSMPFWAILLAHMGHNYGYETLMTELPTYMKQVLHFSIKDVREFVWIFEVICSSVFIDRTAFCPHSPTWPCGFSQFASVTWLIGCWPNPVSPSPLSGKWSTLLVNSTNKHISATVKKQKFSGQYGPAVALFIAAYTGCDKWLTVGLLTLGVGLNGGIYSGFKVNHLDISPQFAGILMSFTNCLANLAGLLAPIYAGYMVKGTVSWHQFTNVLLRSS